VLVEQLADVLDAAAKAGVVHRDVQPRNIFLVRSGEGAVDARLLDFGMCRLRGTGPGAAMTQSAAIIGTPGFLAPEQVSDGFGDVGPHTDVFALACIAYLALCGQRAFEARDPAAGAYDVLNHHPAPLRSIVPELPEAIDWVLSLALAKRPVDRYRTAGDFARDLKGAARGALSTSISRRALSLASGDRPQMETLST
jgi:serine/threonine-protein kinase